MVSECFVTVSEKVNAAPIRSNDLAWCPTMDLVAFISDTDEITLNRLSGQRVWSVLPWVGNSAQVSSRSISWRPDGKVLAVGFDNGEIQYLDVNDGRVINTMHGDADNDIESVCLLKWIEGEGIDHSSDSTELRYDVRTQLPQLSPIPLSSTERIYNSAQAVQTLIHDLELTTSRLKFLAVASQSGNLRVLLGSFHLDLIRRSHGSSVTSIVDYNASFDLVTHSIVSKTEDGLYLDVYRMKIFDKVDRAVEILTNTFNDFYAVSSYLAESLDYIEEEFVVLVETRSESFQKLAAVSKGGSSYDDFFTLLMTGVPTNTLQEWLDQQVSERLLKRWEKICTTSFNNMRRVILDSCLPACERLIIMNCKLRELAANAEDQSSTSLKIEEIDFSIRNLSLLLLRLHQLLRAINTELELFGAFCKWLSFALDRLHEDDDTPDAPMPVSVSTVVRYLKTQHPEGVVSSFFGEKIVNIDPWLTLDKAVDTLEPFPSMDDASSPTLKQVKICIDKAIAQVFKSPAKLLVSQWLQQDRITLTDSKQVVLDTRFITTSNTSTLYTVAAIQGDDSLEIFMIRRTVNLKDGRSLLSRCKIELDIPDVDELHIIQDLKFIDDQEVIILLHATDSSKNNKTSHLVAVAYTDLAYSEVLQDKSEPVCSHSMKGMPVAPSKHRALDHGVHPVAITVNGREGRRTGLYLFADRQRYVIFDLDDAVGEDDEDDEIDEVDDDDGD